MPSTFTGNTGIELIADGEQAGAWGQTTNLNFDIVDRALNGSVDVALSGTTHTLTTSDGVLSDGQFAVLTFTGSPSGTNTVTIAPNTAQKLYFVRNTTAQTVVLSQGSGANVSIPAGTSKVVFSNGAGAGAAVFDITNTLSGNITGNASTATALQTARTIGGVSFNGTANINLPGVNIGGNQNTTGSAASLTTARTFTIGNTGKTFNGTANVSWSLSEIGVGTLGQQNSNSVTITGGTINGTVIGGLTPAAISGTTGSFSGDVSIADKIVHTGDTNTAIRFPANDTVTVETNGAERLRVNSTGNVGIGKSPGSQSGFTILDIGSGSTSGLIDIRQNNVEQTRLFNSGTSAVFANSLLDGALTFITRSAGGFGERLRITSTGNVGIGTSSPAARLDVSADALIHGATVGRGGGAIASNTAVGSGALSNNTTGGSNTANGFQALFNNTTGINNTAAGRDALRDNTTGDDNTANGREALRNNTTGTSNIGIGRDAGSALTTGSNNTIIGRIAGTAGLANTVIIGAGTQERLRITGAGNVGIGTSSPLGKFHVNQSADNQGIVLGNSFRGSSRIEWELSGINNEGFSFRHNNGTDSQILYLAQRTSHIWRTNNAERARIDALGNLLVGTTVSTPGVANTLAGISLRGADGAFFSRTPAGGDATVTANRNSSDGLLLDFRREGSSVGSISVTTTTTSYNTSSDYRLKEDVQPMSGASDRVLALKPCNFAWKADGSRVDGFIAHEAQAVVPTAVTGEKDGEEMQAIDQSKLVPLLTAALQDALKRIEALEAQLNP